MTIENEIYTIGLSSYNITVSYNTPSKEGIQNLANAILEIVLK